MLKLVFVIGALFGFVCGATAEAARDGFLWGWVVVANGVTMCEEPYVWAITKEIECDRRRR
jgi:hypothetical protein